MNNHSPITIIVAVLIIAGSMALLFRWHVISSSIGVNVWTDGPAKLNFRQANGKVVCVDE